MFNIKTLSKTWLLQGKKLKHYLRGYNKKKTYVSITIKKQTNMQ